MKYSIEQIKLAKNAQSAEELIAAAAENGITLSKEEAGQYFDKLHQQMPLSEEELDNVSGGSWLCGPNEPDDPAKVTQTYLKCDNPYCYYYAFSWKVWTGYFDKDYTCKCSECNKGNLYVMAWKTIYNEYIEK